MKPKELIFSAVFVFISFIACAQIVVSVNVTTAGSFRTAFIAAGGNKATVTNLTVTGNIDARDVKFMRDSLPLLAVLDIETVQIKAYNGAGGTSESATSYPANTMPEWSFGSETFNPGNWRQGNGTLKKVVFPTGLKVIGSYAFYLCWRLADTLKIPDSVTSIENSAFTQCDSLTVLRIPGSVTSIGNNTFSSCYYLTGELLLPKGLKTIGQAAFDGCKFNSVLKVPEGIKIISDRAFQGCEFTGLLLPNSLKTIEYDAFYSCYSLTGDLIIPNSVTTIINGFRYCRGITAVYLPGSVTSLSSGIYNQAFQGCRNLEKFVIDNSMPPVIDSSTFTEVNKNTCELIVPLGSKTTYQAASGWNMFVHITEAIFVTLNTQGGYPVKPVTTTLTNSTIAVPDVPARDGYSFAGWYKEAECNHGWDFATDIVTTPVTLYAKWTQVPVSIAEQETPDIQLYPNPATTVLYLDNLPQHGQISIFGTDGKLLKEQNITESKGTINIENLPKGIYLLMVNANEVNFLQKFIKR